MKEPSCCGRPMVSDFDTNKYHCDNCTNSQDRVVTMKEEHQMSENMKTFFTKLLELKEFVKREQNSMSKIMCDIDCPNMNGYHNITLRRIYDQLDAIIKEKQ